MLKAWNVADKPCSIRERFKAIAAPPLYVLPVKRFARQEGATPFMAFLAAVFSLGILMSVLSLLFEQVALGKIERARDLAILGIVAVLENFGYRQLCNLWRIQGWWQYLRKNEQWGPMARKAFKRN